MQFSRTAQPSVFTSGVYGNILYLHLCRVKKAGGDWVCEKLYAVYGYDLDMLFPDFFLYFSAPFFTKIPAYFPALFFRFYAARFPAAVPLFPCA